MPAQSYEFHGVSVLEFAKSGPPLTNAQDALEMIQEALGCSASLVVLPVERLDETFFHLRTGLAGEIVQKFANYRLRVAIVGDLSERAAKSSSLRDFLYEANRGNTIWFVSTIEEVEKRLAAQ